MEGLRPFVSFIDNINASKLGGQLFELWPQLFSRSHSVHCTASGPESTSIKGFPRQESDNAENKILRCFLIIGFWKTVPNHT